MKSSHSMTIDVRASHPEYGQDRLYRAHVSYGVNWGRPDHWGSTMARSHQGDPDEIEDLRVERIDGWKPTPKDAGLPFEHTSLCKAIVQAIYDSEAIVGSDPVTGEEKTAHQLLIDHAAEELRASEPELPEEEEE
jgi:hypothetical protein